MKIRSDFVTNSSSSSFVCVNIESDTFRDILMRFQDALEEECFTIEFEGNAVVLSVDNIMEPIAMKEEIVYSLMALVCDTCDYPYDFNDERAMKKFDEKMQAYANLPDDEKHALQRMAYMLYVNRDAINNDLAWFKAEVTDGYYGGDADAPLEADSYPEEKMKPFLKFLAEQNGCDVEDVDDNMIMDFCAGATTYLFDVFEYNKDTGEVKTESDFSIEIYFSEKEKFETFDSRNIKAESEPESE